jgi:RNA recognition motif-containing protein
LICTLQPIVFNVLPAKIIKDRETGRSQGFGFVTFATTKEASAALQTINIALQAMKNQVLSVFVIIHLAKF